MNLRNLQLDDLWEYEKLTVEMGGVIWANRSFRIQNGCIYFSGGFSRWWIIRVIQKGWDNLFPAKYELKYCKVRVARLYNMGIDPYEIKELDTKMSDSMVKYLEDIEFLRKQYDKSNLGIPASFFGKSE